jgi:hypothetical protein
MSFIQSYYNVCHLIYVVLVGVADPNSSLRVPNSDPDPTLMSTTLTETENVTTYACCLAPGGPTNKENKLGL